MKHRMELVDDTAYRRLWAAVLCQAIKDVDDPKVKQTYDPERDEALPPLYWIFSHDESPHSMRWICDMLDLDYGKLQTMCMTRDGRKKLLGRLF